MFQLPKCLGNVISYCMKQFSTLLATETERQQLVEGVLRSNRSKATEPSHVEAMLLEWFVMGELTLDQTLTFLEAASEQ
ncbi:hypothetical protein GCM10027511_20120 [Hymenobacter humi]